MKIFNGVAAKTAEAPIQGVANYELQPFSLYRLSGFLQLIIKITLVIIFPTDGTFQKLHSQNSRVSVCVTDGRSALVASEQLVVDVLVG